jgi:hypothetical protein
LLGGSGDGAENIKSPQELVDLIIEIILPTRDADAASWAFMQYSGQSIERLEATTLEPQGDS